MAENVMRYGETGSADNFFYLNEMNFPILADMEQAVLLLVSAVKNWKREGNSVILQTRGDFYKKRFFYRFFDFRATYDLEERHRNICVKITVCADHTVRVQAAQGFSIPDRASEMLVDGWDSGTDFTVKETETELILSTAAMDVVITKDPWNLKMQDKTGKVFFNQYTTCKTQDNAVMKYEQCPFGFLYDTKEEKTYAAEQIEFKTTEHFYGFGEKFTSLDKKGQNLTLWHTNALGCNTERTYKNIPFFMSSKGYGVFMHTSNAINCNMGEHLNKAYALMTTDDVIDYFVIYGPSMKEILPRYTDLTGKTPLPPKWSYGFWISKISYRSREEVETLAKRFRLEGIPCDVIHLDTDWYEYNWICDYKFSTTRFPNPEEMIQELGKQGFKITLWQMPYIENNKEFPNAVYQEGFEKGYFAMRPDGQPDFEHGLIDVSNPEAVQWYQEKLLRPLLEMGVAAIKVDFGESAPPFYQYAGQEGEKMHNLFPLLYNKAVFEITKKVRGEEEGIIWARSTWAGSQRYPVHWAGDPDVDFHALVSTIKAGLSFGLSGFPFWSHDIGGFNAPTSPEVYARWLQVGMFTSHSRAHGVKTREPWDFGEEVKEIAKSYIQLRYRLLPYIYSKSYECTKTSLPMVRALVLEYPEDENVAMIDDEYLFADSFLVAPIMDTCCERKIYLPAGVWTDYWTGKQYQGEKWISYTADLKTLPLFLRENAIIPMGPAMNYVDELPCDPITLDLCPVCGNSTFDLIEDKKVSSINMDCSEDTIVLTFDLTKNSCVLRFRNTSAKTVTINGQPCNYTEENGDLIVNCAPTGKTEVKVEKVLG